MLSEAAETMRRAVREGRLALGPASRGFLRVAARGLKPVAARPVWVFAGENMRRQSDLADAAGDMDFRPLNREVQRAARSLRDPYIDYIGSLAPDSPASSWWRGCLSEKNIWASKTFLHLSFALAVAETLRSLRGERPLVAVVENNALLRSLFQWLDRPAPAGWRRVRSAAEFEARRLKRSREFINQWKKSIALAGKAFPEKHTLSGSGPFTLIYSWTDGYCFDARGAFRDRYFGSLQEKLAERGENAAVWPVPLDPLNAAHWRSLGRCGVPMIPSEPWLEENDFRDVPSGRPAPSPAAFPAFQGCDLAALFADDLKEEKLSLRPEWTSLMFAPLKKWRSEGIEIARILYPFENHLWERALIQEARSVFPNVRLTGVQHARMPDMLLNYFISRREAGRMPLPDRIVANGTASFEKFKASGYPDPIVREGAAFRFEALAAAARQKRAGPAATRADRRPVVLAAAPIDPNEALELIRAFLLAAEDLKETNAVVKCHPDMPFDKLFPGSPSLPENVSVSLQPLAALLAGADLLVYTTSTSCLEALPLPIPIVHYTVQSSLDTDPLEAAPHLRSDAATPEELAAVCKSLLESFETTGELQNARLACLRNCFNPVTEENLEPFC